MTELADYRDTAIGNARALADDAQIVFYAGGRWAIAVELAFSAIEEIGKAWLCHRQLCGLPGVDGVDLRRSHGLNEMAARQFIALATRATSDGMPARPENDAWTEDQTRECVDLASFLAKVACRMPQWHLVDQPQRPEVMFGDAEIIPTQLRRSVG